jgi:hypothetical protein
MAQSDWRQYYGIVIENWTTRQVFVHRRLYGSEAKLAAGIKAAKKCATINVIGTVSIRGNTLRVQRELFERTKPHG